MLKFVYDEKEYVLEKDKNVCFLNDEEKPVEGISLDDILNMIDNLEEIDFDTQYYKEACVDPYGRNIDDLAGMFMDHTRYGQSAAVKNGCQVGVDNALPVIR